MPIRRLVRALALAILSSVPIAAGAQTWKPEKNVELIVPASPGASFDTTARTIQRLLQDQKLVETPVMVMNKPGGGLRVGLNYLAQHGGDPHYLSIITPGLLTNHILGQHPYNYTELTPIAVLFAEYMTFSVRPDSPIRSLQQMAEILRKDPTALSIAVATSRGGALHTAVAMAMKAAGVDIRRLKVVIFTANSESVLQMMGGHVDVAVAPPFTVQPHIASGKARAIAISSPQRLKGRFADVPTWKEQGVNASFASWRGMMGSKGLRPAHIAYWEDALGRLSKTEEWRQDVEKNLWEVNFVAGAPLRAYLDSEYAELKRILLEIEMAK